MVQDGREVIVFSFSYFPVDLIAVFVFVRDNKKALLLEVSFIYFLYGIVRDSCFVAENEPVFIGDEFVVLNAKQVHGEKYRRTDKKWR